MSFGLDDLLALLPADFRRRDAELGERLKALLDDANQREGEEFGPLKSLLSVLARDIRRVEEDIDQLADDFAIETCSDDAVPFLAELLGVRAFRNISDTGDRVEASSQLRARTANAIYNRQAKGTLGALQQAAIDASGWDILAVEYGQRIAETMSCHRPKTTADPVFSIRTLDREALDKPQDMLPRTPEIGSRVSRDRKWNYPNIGLHVYPFHPLRFAKIRLTKADGRKDQHYLSRFKCNQQIWSRAEARISFEMPLNAQNVSVRLTRRTLAKTLNQHYGPGKSIAFYYRDKLVPIDKIRVCNLATEKGKRWNNKAQRQQILIDPELGRVSIGAGFSSPVEAGFSLSRALNIGGSEQIAYNIVNDDLHEISQDDLLVEVANLQAASKAVELIATSSITLKAEGEITLEDGKHFRLIAKQDTCPMLNIGDAGLTIIAGKDSVIEISGVHSMGGPFIIKGSPESVIIKDTTLLPGVSLSDDGDPVAPDETTLRLLCRGANVHLLRTISGPIMSDEFVTLTLEDSVVDAGSLDAKAIFCNTQARRGFLFAAVRSTVIGRVQIEQFQEDAEDQGQAFEHQATSNSLFDATPHSDGISAVDALQIQAGCVRFSALPNGSRVGRTYQCGESKDIAFLSRRYIDADYLWLDPEAWLSHGVTAENGDIVGVINSDRPIARTLNIREAGTDFLRLGFRYGPIFEI